MKSSTEPNWHAIQVQKACRHILRTVSREGVFQFRHYTSRNTKRTAMKHNTCLREAAEQLHKGRQLNIISRRPFGHIFEDGSMLGGVNVTVVSNNFLGGELPAYLQQQAG